MQSTIKPSLPKSNIDKSGSFPGHYILNEGKNETDCVGNESSEVDLLKTQSDDHIRDRETQVSLVKIPACI